MGKVFKSENYLGKRKMNYFEGWYFRHDGGYPFSFIVGVSKNKTDPHSFVQYIDNGQSFYFRFDLKDFRFDKKDMTVTVADNVFSLKGIRVNLRQNGICINANVVYGNPVKFKKSLFAPSVMGPFSYLPMPCNHAVIVLDKSINGTLNVNGEERTVQGKGYIEKDFGKAFPENYIWFHFSGGGVSGIAAVAAPLLFGIKGFLCLISHKGSQHNLSLYTGAKIKKIEMRDNKLKIRIKKGNSELTAEIENNSSARELLAPGKSGEMTRIIKENLNASFKGDLILNGEKIDLSEVKVCAFESHWQIPMV